ncbi:DDE-type integrase/transposase/recombinase [Bradyrhizobium sp. 139]|nr:DDE-type integrase/transposase/recombinase [Bradyrhizobium sp. 139]
MFAASWNQSSARGAGEKPARQPFKQYPIGYFRVDIAEVRIQEGKLRLFMAVDRTLKFAFAQLRSSATLETASTFLEALIKAVSYRIHTVLTDNGVQFCECQSTAQGPTARYRLHGFDRICREQDIEHRLTKPNHPGPTARSNARTAR